MLQQNQICLGCGEIKVEVGSHILVLYEEHEDLVEFLQNYYSEGLKSDDMCFMVNASKEMKKILEEGIKKTGIGDETFNDNLVFLDYNQLYFSNGKFNAQKVYARVNELLQGSRRIRTSGDMTWSDKHNFEEIDSYETNLSERYNSNNIILTCAYSIKRLKAEQLIRLIDSHTKVIYKDSGQWKVSESVERKIFESKIDVMKSQKTKKAK